MLDIGKWHYKRMLSVIPALVAFVAIALGIAAIFNMYSLLEKQTLFDKNLRLAHIGQLADEGVVKLVTDISSSFNRVSVLGGPSNFKTLARQGYRQDLKKALGLHKELRELIAPYSSILDAGVYFSGGDFIVSAAGFFETPAGRAASGYCDGFLAPGEASAWFSRERQFRSGVAERVFTYTLSLPVSSREGAGHAVFYMDVSASMLSDDFLSALNPETEVLYIHDETGEELMRLAAGDTMTGEPAELAPNRMLRHVSEQSGWTFTMASLGSMLYHPWLGVLVTYSVIAGVLILLALWGSCYLRGKLYNPVRQLLRSVAPDNLASASDELTLIDHSFHRLSSQLTDVKQQMHDVLWYALLEGPSDYERFDALLPQFTHAGFYALLIQEESPVRQRLLETVLSDLLGERYIVRVIPMEQQMHVAVINTDLADGESLAFLGGVMERLGTAIQAECYVALGDRQDSLLDVSLSYFRAQEAMNCRYLCLAARFYAYGEIRAWPDYNLPIPMEELASAILSGQAERALALLDALRDSIRSHSWSAQSVEYTVGLLSFFLDNLADTQSLSVCLPYRGAAARGKNLLESLDGLRLIAENMANMTRDRQHKEPHSSIDRIRQYIDDHLGTDLSLSELSRVGGLNVSYISTQFKKSYGVGVVHYINQKRLEMSRILLTGSDYNIDEIAGKVGYQSASYFIKRFSHAYAQTPNAYRQKHYGANEPVLTSSVQPN